MGSDDKVFTQENPFLKFVGFLYNIIDKPTEWFREFVTLPNREKYYWYHEKLRRVPTVDECYTDDEVCQYEADQQFKRDKKVDKFIVEILRKRYEYCQFDNPYDKDDCNSLKETFDKAAVNYLIKYGDLGYGGTAIKCLMKQKNRMAWERRHGPIGSGKRPPKEESWKKEKKHCD